MRAQRLIDYFYYSTKGYLVAPTGDSYINQVIGIGLPRVSSDSEFRREGWEFQLGWRDKVGDFTYDISGNFTLYNSPQRRLLREAKSRPMSVCLVVYHVRSGEAMAPSEKVGTYFPLMT